MTDKQIEITVLLQIEARTIALIEELKNITHKLLTIAKMTYYTMCVIINSLYNQISTQTINAAKKLKNITISVIHNIDRLPRLNILYKLIQFKRKL